MQPSAHDTRIIHHGHQVAVAPRNLSSSLLIIVIMMLLLPNRNLRSLPTNNIITEDDNIAVNNLRGTRRPATALSSFVYTPDDGSSIISSKQYIPIRRLRK